MPACPASFLKLKNLWQSSLFVDSTLVQPVLVPMPLYCTPIVINEEQYRGFNPFTAKAYQNLFQIKRHASKHSASAHHQFGAANDRRPQSDDSIKSDVLTWHGASAFDSSQNSSVNLFALVMKALFTFGLLAIVEGKVENKHSDGVLVREKCHNI
ncbi:hypothetical protein EVAR_65495_1 [Eumeta japonica]|uniref:Uncharacterized protein n=1 Tax=Eumeta variegata TaxID=151549 RepID=A0A4C2A5B1_EUMVA|nr:hypothetical protein EVAR_65495_1 [Eumeta japonica]